MGASDLSRRLRSEDTVCNLFGILYHDAEASRRRLEVDHIDQHKRLFVRDVGAFVEGVVHSLRAYLLACERNDLAPEEVVALTEELYERDATREQRGWHILRPAKILLLFQVLQRLSGEEGVIKARSKGWGYLVKTLALSHRLLHPVSEADLAIELAELRAARISFFWFTEQAWRTIFQDLLAPEAWEAEIEANRQRLRRELSELERRQQEKVGQFIHHELSRLLINEEGGLADWGA